MKSFLFLLSLILLFICLQFVQAQEMPAYHWGESPAKWGVELLKEKDAPLNIRMGARLHTVARYSDQKVAHSSKRTNLQDFYARRVRLQFEANFKEGIKYYMDLRNDDANKEDLGEKTFNIGDAYVEVKRPWGIESMKLRAFRAKVNVSRSETVSSSQIILLDRSFIADEAAQYVSHNRRATNVQLMGHLHKKLQYQVVIGDGVHADKFHDAKAAKLAVGSVKNQDLMYGAKLRFSPLKDFEDDQLSETYLGRGQHLSFGLGYFKTGGIEYAATLYTGKTSRELMVADVSTHYKNLFVQAEYFKFNGVVQSFSAATENKGSSDGWYAQAEYVLPQLSYIAPFVRVENWNRFRSLAQYQLKSFVSGLTWYLKGDSARFGIFYQKDDYQDNILLSSKYASNQQVKLTTMWLF